MMMRPCKPQIYHFFLEGRPEPERWRTQACSGSSGRPRSWDLRPPRLSFFRANISLERKKKHYECNANPRSCDSETTLASCLPTVSADLPPCVSTVCRTGGCFLGEVRNLLGLDR